MLEKANSVKIIRFLNWIDQISKLFTNASTKCFDRFVWIFKHWLLTARNKFKCLLLRVAIEKYASNQRFNILEYFFYLTNKSILTYKWVMIRIISKKKLAKS